MYLLIRLISLVLAIGIAYFLFTDAQKRNMEPAWAWALGGFFCWLIVLPVPDHAQTVGARKRHAL